MWIVLYEKAANKLEILYYYLDQIINLHYFLMTIRCVNMLQRLLWYYNRGSRRTDRRRLGCPPDASSLWFSVDSTTLALSSRDEAR